MKNIIKISEFNEIVKGIKAMKADYVCVYNDTLIGIDYTASMIKIYKMPLPIPVQVFTIITKELSSKFFSNIVDTNILIDFDESKIYCPNHKAYADESGPMIDNNKTDIILSMYGRLIDSISKVHYIKSFGYIDDEEGFQRTKNIRSADGAILYEPGNICSYGMYIYSGAIPVNKADSTTLDIYDQGMTFISKFTVYKKKSNPIEIYFRFAKLK